MVKIYRRIWEQANGPIPVDEDGRSYEIHHINKNHSDNRLENLLCVSIEEHFAIHLKQGDFGAASAILKRMGVQHKVQCDLNRLAGKIAGHLSKKNKTGWNDPKIQSKGGKAMRGRYWFTNGVQDTKASIAPGPDWYRGRSKTKNLGFEKGKKIGQFWNKDGVNKRSFECPGDGWIPGKYLTPEQRLIRSEIAKKVSTKRWSNRNLK